MIITPDLKQNVFYMVYFVILHNWQAIAYILGLVLSAVAAVARPRRSFVLLLIGFFCLLFGFEYSKHIQEGLKEQTVQSLITIQEHSKVRRIVTTSIDKLIPLGLSIFGWLSVILGGYMLLQEVSLYRKSKSKRTSLS